MKSITLILLVMLFNISNNSVAFGINAKVAPGKTFEYHSDIAILLLPIYAPLIGLKFTFYDFPRAVLSIPCELGKKLHPSSYSEVESLIRNLNDRDVSEKGFIIYRLKYITDQSFGYPGPLTKDQEKAVIKQWNQWWRGQSQKRTK